MSTTCETVRDLIPLCVDKTASEESEKIIKEHLASCPECRQYYRLCQRTTKDEICSKALPQVDQQYARLSKRIKHRRNVKMLLAAVISFVIGVRVVNDLLKYMKITKKVQNTFPFSLLNGKKTGGK